jgi:chitinase
MARRRALTLVSVSALVAGTGAFVALAVGTANSAAVDNEQCRPDGLYRTPGVAVPYCAVYDTNGREKMGADHQRRIIGYFTGWRHGKNGQPAYLVKDIPWTN